jgi:primosomal protein N' (replication factor Y)
MYIIRAIPIVRGFNKDTLSYFSKISIQPGAAVSIPIRGSIRKALVLECQDARQAKSEIRRGDFSLKGVAGIHTSKLVTDTFMSASSELSEYCASSIGAVLTSLIPHIAYENENQSIPASPSKENNITPPEPIVINGGDGERFGKIYAICEEHLSNAKSIYILAPENETVEQFHKQFSAHVDEKRIGASHYFFHGKRTKKALYADWHKAVNEKKPTIIIGTGQYLSLPRTDIGAIIIEREGSGAYKSQSRPYVDFRIFAKILTRHMQASLIYADTLPRTETVYENDSDIKNNDIVKNSIRIIHAEKSDSKSKKIVFSIFSNPTIEAMRHEISRDENIFVFALRHGLGTSVVCRDCGTSVICKRCNSPVVLHGGNSESENYFLCHRCGHKRSAAERCIHCDSWNLSVYGIGIENTAKELHELFPDKKVSTLSPDATKNKRNINSILQAFYETKGSILVGSESALSYMTRPIGLCVIASIDTLFSIADYKALEKAGRIILRLRNLADNSFIIQTRQKDSFSSLEDICSGKITEFYKNEYAVRKLYGYPPFKTIIKISAFGTKISAPRDRDAIEKSLLLFKPSSLPYIVRTKSGYVASLIVKVDSWPNSQLVELFRNFSPGITVDVNPERIW